MTTPLLTKSDVATTMATLEAPCELWAVAINNRWVAPYTVTPAGGDALAAEDAAIRYYAKAEPLAGPVVSMSFEQLMAWERRRMLAMAVVRPSDEEAFTQALNCLPPAKWERGADFERFCISEMTSGTWTTQHARHGERYATKHVDITDRSTWLTPEEVDAAHA
jgi:hypothetical protein